MPSKVLTRRLQIKVEDHPAELNNSCLGPSDSYTGALQSTLTCQVNFWLLLDKEQVHRYLPSFITDKFSNFYGQDAEEEKSEKRGALSPSRQALSSLSGMLFRQKSLQIEVLGEEMP